MRCWQALALASASWRARVEGASRRFPAFGLAGHRTGSIDSSAKGGIKWPYCVSGKGADSQSTLEILFTTSRITWERSEEEEWSFCREVEYAKLLFVLWMRTPSRLRSIQSVLLHFCFINMCSVLSGD